MSIATAINDLSGRIEDAYTVLEGKGATIPASKDTYHLSAAIDSIETGNPPMYGIDSAEQFLGANLNGLLIFTKVPAPMFDLDLSGITAIYQYQLYYKFYQNPWLRSVSIPDIQTLYINALEYAF